MMSRDPGALSYLLSSGSISIPKMCFSRAQGTKPNCTEYMGKWEKKKVLEVGVRRKVMCGTGGA